MSFFISSLNGAKRGRVARAHFLDDCLPAAAVVWNCGWYEAEEKEDVARRDVALWRRCLVRFGTFYRFEKSVTPYSLPPSLPYARARAGGPPPPPSHPPPRRAAPSQPRCSKLALLGKKLISSFFSLLRTLSCSLEPRAHLGGPSHRGRMAICSLI